MRFMTFGKNLRNLRLEGGLTQKQFASIINLNQSSIARFENGERFPDFGTLAAISKKFDVSLDWLMGLEVSEKRMKAWSDKDMAKLLSKIEGLLEAKSIQYGPDRVDLSKERREVLDISIHQFKNVVEQMIENQNSRRHSDTNQNAI